MSDCEAWQQRAAKLLQDAIPPPRMDWRKRREWYTECRALLEEADKRREEEHA